MRYWTVTVLEDGVESVYKIDGGSHSKDRIKEILKETHGRWDIADMSQLPIEDLET